MPVASSLRFTYRDYLLLPEDRRYEIIEGDLFMTPSPRPEHQMISSNLQFALESFAREQRLGRVLAAPCDVVLSETDVVHPDILFIAANRFSIIGENYISAAPDQIIEILSPSTAERDRTLKTKLYARFGVRELWIADPEAKTIDVFVNSSEGFRRDAVFRMDQVLRSTLLPGLEIPLADVFRADS